VATNKFINENYKEQIMEWIKMTKVARWFEEEKIEAVNKAVSDAVRKTRNEAQSQIAQKMLISGDDFLKVMECTGLTRAEVDKVQMSISA